MRVPDRKTLFLAWALLPALTPVRTRKLLARFDPPETALSADPLRIAEALSIDPTEAARVRDPLTIPDLARAIENVRDSAITLGEAAYPPLLAAIADPPLAIFVRGDRSLLGRVPVAVVGARRATPYGENVARHLARGLATLGAAVISGMARGIDAAAHRAALDTPGATIAVLGTGIDVAYPPENRRLRDRIAEEGLLVTELPPGTPPRREQFPIRNRIIAGLSLGVIVVEAGARSGSLITARLASEGGREVCAVPGSIFSEVSEGAHRLIQDGAKLVHRLEDVLVEIPPLAELARNVVRAALPPALDRELQSVLALFSVEEPVGIDMAAEKLGVRVEQMAPALLELELRGLIRAKPGARWIRVAD